jgi:hypothetical protein
MPDKKVDKASDLEFLDAINAAIPKQGGVSVVGFVGGYMIGKALKKKNANKKR